MTKEEAQRIANNFFTRYEGSKSPEEIYSTEMNNRLRDQILDAFNTSHPTNPSDANHHTCPECSWLCSCSDQPCRCCSDEHKTTTLPSDEEIYKQSKISCKGNSHAMRYLPMLNQFRQGAKWMRSICQAKLAEMEKEIESLKDDIDVLKARLLLND